jgi:hypothetical protein
MTAISNHTKGPWMWTVRDDGTVQLHTPDRGWLIVMDFVRHKMQSAIPRFAKWNGEQRGRMGGVMVPATAEILAESHDARLITAAPDFYEAAWLIDVLSESNGQPVDGFRFREAVQMLRAALKKVHGEE